MRVMTLDRGFNPGPSFVTCSGFLQNPPMTELPQEDLWVRFIDEDESHYSVHVFRDRTSAISTPLDLTGQVMYQTGVWKTYSPPHSLLLLDNPSNPPDYTGCALDMEQVAIPAVWGGCVWSYAEPVVTPSAENGGVWSDHPPTKEQMRLKYRPDSPR
jgi:hypothetical protein